MQHPCHFRVPLPAFPLSRLKRAFGAFVHYFRWGWRFGSFGFRSRLTSPDLLTRPDRIHLGRGVCIWKSSRLEVVSAPDLPIGKIEIGDDSVIHPYFHCGAVLSVKIGSGVLIASRVMVTDHDHEFNDVLRPPSRCPGLRASPVEISDGAWIGEGAVILKGVRIGKRAVIGANSVVTRSVPDRSIAVGNPARVIRTLEVMA